jgi:hypothetical protein
MKPYDRKKRSKNRNAKPLQSTPALVGHLCLISHITITVRADQTTGHARQLRPRLGVRRRIVRTMIGGRSFLNRPQAWRCGGHPCELPLCYIHTQALTRTPPKYPPRQMFSSRRLSKLWTKRIRPIQTPLSSTSLTRLSRNPTGAGNITTLERRA